MTAPLSLVNVVEPSPTIPKKFIVNGELTTTKPVSGWYVYMRYFLIELASGDESLRVDWLVERGRFFEKFCAPSLVQQLRKFGGTCFLYVTAGYEQYLPKIVAESIKEGIFKICYAETQREAGESFAAYVDKIRSNINPEDVLLITRLDNDDSLSEDFYQVCSQIFSHAGGGIIGKTISFAHGVQYNNVDGDFYSYIFTNNHFLSKFVGKSSPGRSRILFGNHSKIFINDKDCLVFLTSLPMWCENVHGNNLINQMRTNLKLDVDLNSRFCY